MFTVEIWSVAHGSAAHVHAPNGRCIVIDAGASDEFSPTNLLVNSRTLPTGVMPIDQLVISHPHQDHVTELPQIVAQLRPRIFTRNGFIPKALIYPYGDPARASQALKHYEALDTLYTNPVVDLPSSGALAWAGLVVEHFVNVPDDLVSPNLNDLSVVTCVRYGQLSVVFSGDLTPAGQAALLRRTDVRAALRAGSVRILVAPHHGRRSGIFVGNQADYKWVDAVAPHLVVMSDVWGSEHTCPEIYGPKATGLHILTHSGVSIGSRSVLTTKTNSRITIQHDGLSTWVYAI